MKVDAQRSFHDCFMKRLNEGMEFLGEVSA